MLSARLKHQTVRGRFALLIALVVSIGLALLLVAPAASAEVAEGLAPISSDTASAADPVEQVPEIPAAANAVPVEHAEAPSPAPTPTETPKATKSAGPAHAARVTSAVREQLASATTNPPVAATSANAAGRSVKAIADSAAEHRLPALAESVRQNSETTIEGIRQDSAAAIVDIRKGAEQVSKLAGRLSPGELARPSLSPLLDPAKPGSGAIVLPSASPPQTNGDPSQDGILSTAEPQTRLFPPLWSPAASIEHTSGYSTLSRLGKIETVSPGLGETDTLGKILPAAAESATTASPDRTAHGPARPAPADIPLPAAIAPGSGGSFFVPFAALLALLALVAPASMRRLREAADFRAPTPFVCALERPG